MPEIETPSEETEQVVTTEEVDETPNPEEATETSTETQEDELPDWVKKELKDVRSEAANYRVQLREAQAKLEGAKTPEEFAAAIAEISTKNAELERSLMVTKVASKHELPAELAELLKGDDEATLEAHAKTLAALITPKKDPESLTGGLSPLSSDDDFDPVAAAHAAKKRPY